MMQVVELTLRLPGYRPFLRGPVTVGRGQSLPDKKVDFLRV